MTTPDWLHSERPTLSVGILAADLLSLGSELRLLEDAGVTVVHVDVMDGCFTPMMTVGPPFVKGLRTPLLKDVHLMIREPLEKLADYVAAGADLITVHQESCVHIHRVLQVLGQMRHAADPQRRVIRGIALNPGTPVTALEPLVSDVEMVVLLAINPGWGGQSFIPATFDRLRQVRQLAEAHGRDDLVVCVDGGVTRANAAAVAAAGADLVVTGSAVFDGRQPAENARAMLAAVGQARHP
ncbi:MAG TPA: ribulose-phosphate 3-epimerase [Vicinamibacterales bacterium]|nr:ribulose-phosphate 3-epimerase [Vicinamibacterales bacterium]